MPKCPDPKNRYVGKHCDKHPELGGLRQVSNYTCVQCQRDQSNAQREKRRVAQGKSKSSPMPKEEAVRRLKLRDKIRNKAKRAHPEYCARELLLKKEWRAKNRDRHLATNRAYDAKQLRENLQRRVSKNLRTRLRKAVIGETRGASAVGDLGMSIDSFREYIAEKFTLGMSWDNYGAWHLDHVRPLASFDLSDSAQIRAACHYLNYQPLWAIDNQRKYCKQP